MAVLLLAASATAQSDGTGPAPPAEDAPRAPAIEESPLPTYMVPDKDGNLVEMPGFSYADFLKAYEILEGLAQQDPRPPYSIQWLSVIGEATNGHAELVLTARVLVHERRWVRVPLRLDQAMVQAPVELDDPDAAEAFLHPDTDGEGYVCYLRGEPDERHTIKLKLLVPLSTAGGRTRLALRLPRAPTSELKLKVPMTEVAAEVSEGTTLMPPTSSEDGTELSVLGVGGDFRLSWYEPETDAAAIPVVLQADGAVSARMDGQTIAWNANVSVRSFRAPFDRFQVRLPPHAELVPDDPAGYSVAPVDSEEADPSMGRLVEVRLDRKTSGPVDVALAARRTVEGEPPPSDWLDLTGFAVVDAVRQWGYLAVIVPNDWQVLWGSQRGVHRVEQLPEPLRREDVVAGFEYSMQPALLHARLVPKTTRLTVDPEYVVLAGAERADLQARLRYSVRGANLFALQVGLSGWQVDAVEPENLVVLDGIEVDEDDTLHIPLLQPTRGDLEIAISAHREMPPLAGDEEAVSLELPLPKPHADTTGAALLAVLPDDNLELTPDPERTSGLVRQRTVPALELPPRQQAPLHFRGEAPDAVFAASIRRLPQRIQVSTSARVALRPGSAEVRQTFEYTVLHEPAERFVLEVPEPLATAGGLEILHEGATVPARPLGDEPTGDDAPTVLWQVDLPDSHIGHCQLVLHYSVPLPPAPDRGWLPASVPLVTPREAEPEVNRLVFEETADLFAEVADETWKPADSTTVAESLEPGERSYVSAGPRRQVGLRIGPPDSRVLGTTTVERAWVQTWLIRTDRSDRQDRAVFRVRSNRNRLAVRLPQGTAMEQVFVWLNEERVEDFAVDGNRLYLPLPGNGAQQTHLLELGYHFREPMDRRGALSIELPHLDERVWARRMYWQLVLPRHEHVVAAPRGFTSESPWQWTNYLFARRPLLEQAELEEWSGAARRTPVSHETNRYLFGASGYPRRAVLRTANRSWIVLGASGLALVAGLVLIYIPAGRHPATLGAFAVALACAGALYPAPTLLVAQAASLGLALTLLAGLLERSVARRRAAMPTPGPGPEGDSPLTQREAAWPGEPAATPTASMAVGPEAPQDAFP